MSDQKYNGWNNYATWCVNLWLSNDQGTHETVCEAAQEKMDEHGDRQEAERALAGWLEAYCDDMRPEGIDEASMWGDLLQHAYGSVDWRELAESYLADIDEPVQESDEDE